MPNAERRAKNRQKVVMNFVEKYLDKRVKRWYNVQAVFERLKNLRNSPLNPAHQGLKKVLKKLLEKYLTNGAKGGIIIESFREGDDRSLRESE